MRSVSRLTAPVIVLALAGAACTGAGGEHEGGATRSGDGTPTFTVTAPPGTAVYRYENAGLTATLLIKGSTGTLEIENATGRELPKPSFYILDARDGSRVDGEVADAADIADGQTARFDVSFAGIEPKNIGLLILLVGKDNYGAFVEQ